MNENAVNPCQFNIIGGTRLLNELRKSNYQRLQLKKNPTTRRNSHDLVYQYPCIQAFKESKFLIIVRLLYSSILQCLNELSSSFLIMFCITCLENMLHRKKSSGNYIPRSHPTSFWWYEIATDSRKHDHSARKYLRAVITSLGDGVKAM